MGSLKQKIDSLFDYCGDNAKNAGSAGPRTYSTGYSPNNIRQVVISPNGVFVSYHIATSGTDGRRFKFIEFKENELYLEERDPKYKSILSRLADPLICSCVEEIVVLSKALTGYPQGNYMSEIELSSLISSFKGGGSDLKERISKRYERLRYYTVLDVNFKEFISYYRAMMKSGYKFMTDMPEFKIRSNITEFAGQDYCKHWNTQTRSYALDTQLQSHFAAIREKYEAEEKAKAVDVVRDKRIGGKLKDVNGYIEAYLQYSSLWKIFYNIVSKEGTNGVLPDLNFVRKPEIIQVLPFKGMTKVPDSLVSKQPCSESEALEKNEAMLKTYPARCSKVLAEALFGGLNGVLIRNEPFLLKTIVDGCETVVYVPKELEGLASQIHSLTGVKFGGREVDVSIVNSCSQFMRYFVACENTQPFMKEYWRSKLTKGVAK